MNTNLYSYPGIAPFIIDPSKEPDTVKARQAKARYLSGLNLAELNNGKIWKMEAIKFLALGLVPTASHSKRFNKSELIEALSEYCREQRETQTSWLAGFLEEAKISERTIERIFEGFERNIPDEDILEFTLASLRANHTSPKSLTKTGIPNLLKALRGDARATCELAGKIELLDKGLRKATRDDLEKINQDYRDTVEAQNEALEIIHETPIREFMSEVAAHTSKYDWITITYAIALATGRRQAEILGNHSEWEATEDPEIIRFKGLLKTVDKEGKTRIDEWVDVKVLYVTAQKILEWVEILELKKVAPDRVNAVRTKDIASRKKEIVSTMLLNSGLTMFKDARTFYAAKIMEAYRLGETSMAETAYVKKFMHHSDLITAHSYQKYNLQP